MVNILILQPDYLLRKLIERQKGDLMENEGVTEQRSKATWEYRFNLNSYLI